MSYQKCPKCDGTGNRNNPVYTGHPWLDLAQNLPSATELLDKDYSRCPVCNGKMIINTETGLPPEENI